MFREMRRKKQELSREDCKKILKSEKRGVLSVIGELGYSYGVPMDFYFDEEEEKIYFHGASEGHKTDALKRNDKACFTVWSETGTDEDGWSKRVASVIARGRAEIADDGIKEKVVRKLGLKYYPKEDDEEKEILQSIGKVQIIALKIEYQSGKSVHEK